MPGYRLSCHACPFQCSRCCLLPDESCPSAQALVAEATRLRLLRDDTRWVDLSSYSARQARSTPIGGFIGRCSWEGEVSPQLRELLVWGELLHVGKNAVKGAGHYRIACAPA